MLDFVIVGGGVHAVHFAVRLVLDLGWDPERMSLIDPEPTLLGRWRRRTAAVGMTHLRSPDVHHLGLSAFDLRDSAPRRSRARPGLGPLRLARADGGKRRRSRFLQPYNRPPLDVFDQHAARLIEDAGLAHRHRRAEVLDIELGDPLRLLTTTGPVQARAALLALGRAEAPLPDWASGPSFRHAFAEDALDSCAPSAHVIGGGISAAQVALRILREARASRVILHARHELREHMFDADPGWLGPKFMVGFEAERDPARRRAQIQSARLLGSMPPEVVRALRSEVRAGRVELRTGVPIDRQALDGPTVFATGLCPDLPPLARRLAGRGLPLAPCGAPWPDEQLRWGHPGLFVTGHLAELRLGPTAGNIAGARRAADRLVSSLEPQRASA